MIGGVYLAAWLTGTMASRGISTVTVKTNAALCLVLSGSGLALLVPAQAGAVRRRVGLALALITLLVAGLTFAENVAGWDVGIDQFLAYEVPGALGVVRPNQMGVPASSSFMLIAAALLMLARGSGTKANRAVQRLALLVSLIAALPAVGYLFGAHELYGVARLTAIAWPTALGLLLLSIGLFCARPYEGLMAIVTADDPGGALIRQSLPPVALIVLTLGWLRLMGQRLGLYETEMGTALLSVAVIVILSSILYSAGQRISLSSAALRENKQQLSGIIDSAMDAIVAVDASQRIVMFNPAAEKMFRCQAAEALGEAIDRFIPERFREAHRQHIRNFAANGVSIREMGSLGTVSGVRASGEEFPIEASISQVRVTGRELFTVILRDITDRKKTEQALLASHAELRQLNLTLEQRVAERTAEVQLRAVQLRALAAELSRAEQREQRRVAQVLHDGLQQLLVAAKFRLGFLKEGLLQEDLQDEARQVDKLLDESLQASRSLMMELSPPAPHLETMAKLLQWLAGWMRDKHGMTIELDIDGQVNPHAEEVRIVLFQSVREALLNVVKHANVRTASVSMTRIDGGRVKIVVSDCGPGFDPNSRKSDSSSGTGLGLFSIGKRLQLLGGRMDAESAPGRGTQITLVAPMEIDSRSVAGSGRSG